jgi:molecular chaperone GrpE
MTDIDDIDKDNSSEKKDIPNNEDIKLEKDTVISEAQDTGPDEENKSEETIETLQDKFLRAVAENQNLRKRADKEKLEAIEFGMLNFARDLLATADNLGRALSSLKKDEKVKLSEGIKNFHEGVELTEKELKFAFQKYGIEVFNPIGKKFDPNFHQAMFEIPDTDKEDGTIVEVVQEGYMMKDRLLRPALVGIAKKNSNKNNKPQKK